MFAGLWPTFDADQVPITSITNGVHAGTWVAPQIVSKKRKFCVSPLSPSRSRTAAMMRRCTSSVSPRIIVVWFATPTRRR